MGPEESGGSSTTLGEAQGGWAASEELMQQLSDALYQLALTNTHRVGAMCLSPYSLACWALELLEEQACQVGCCLIGLGGRKGGGDLQGEGRNGGGERRGGGCYCPFVAREAGSWQRANRWKSRPVKQTAL